MKLWSSQLLIQFLQLRREAWKIQDFSGVWTRDLAIPVRRSNQLSYEATDVGSWSFVGSNCPVRNESMMKWYIWNESYMNCGYEVKWSYDLRSYHGTIRTHKWPAPNVSGFIAQLVRASHRNREVTGLNPVEVLYFSGFSTQLPKLRS